MKKCSLLLSALFSLLTAFAQPAPDIVITPGVGVNNLKLGMTEKQALAALKGTASWHSYEDQLEAFASDGTRIDSVMQFVLGFDSCARYDSDLPLNMPVFGLYFKNHKLNFITVTSYSASDNHLQRVKIKNGIRFHDSMSDCTAKLEGKPFLPVGYGDYSGDHYYYTLGLEMVYDEEKLTAIGIYPVTAGYPALIAEKAAQLQQEAAQYFTKEEKSGDQAPL